MSKPGTQNYLHHTRRMLLDMHIPDWDSDFLRDYKPEAVADCYVTAGVDAVMMYCKSHLGLAYWPSTTGPEHKGLGGRDAVGELAAALRARGIAVCGYTSVAIDRAAAEDHPDWLIVPARSVDGVPEVSWFRRHSALCMNKPEYLEYEKRQISELLDRYAFDAFFLDMMFWGAICVCADCTRRFADETGEAIPDVVDWTSSSWTAFVAARERWADEFSQSLLAHIAAIGPVPVYQNFAGSFFGWQFGKPVSSYRNDAFLGGDLYGGSSEQLLACKLMLAASPGSPPEYMTSRAPSLRDHVSIKPESQMTLEMFGATSLSCAVLFIDAIDPDGAVNPAVYEQVGRVYERRKPFEAELGGTHVEDVGVYFSSDSLVRLADTGTPITDLAFSPGSPHLVAAIGVMQALQEMHVPAGVVTAAQMEALDEYSVIVLPDVTRMSEREARAFAGYVERGGRLYASGRTGLLADTGAHDEHMLSSVFGVRYVADEDGPEVLLLPSSDLVESAVAPQRHISWINESASTTVPRVVSQPGTEVLARLALPYGYPEVGTRIDQNWSSNYSFPPWTKTDHPVLVHRTTGQGRAVYSAMPLETGRGAAKTLLKSVLADLVGDQSTVSATAPDTVWVETFWQHDRQRYVVSTLDYLEAAIGRQVAVTFRLRLPTGTTLTGVDSVGGEHDFSVSEPEPGVVEVAATIVTFAMFTVGYAGSAS